MVVTDATLPDQDSKQAHARVNGSQGGETQNGDIYLILENDVRRLPNKCEEFLTILLKHVK